MNLIKMSALRLSFGLSKVRAMNSSNALTDMPTAPAAFPVWDDAHAATLDESGLLLYRSNLLGSDLPRSRKKTR
jgi:hypothetical protein